MPVIRATGAVDGTAIQEATQRGLDAYLDKVSVSDLAMAYGGSKSELVRELAGIGPGKLPAKGTDERRAYDSQMRNVNRWMKAESGQGGQTRKPSAATMEKLKSLYLGKNPPTFATIKVTGWIVDPSGNKRHRTINTEDGQTPVNAQDLLDAINRGDDMGAYDAMFAGYAPGSYVESADSLNLVFDDVF